MNDGSKIKKILLGSFIGSAPFFLMFFVIFVVVLFMLGLFKSDESNVGFITSGGYSYTIDGQNISNVKVRLLKCEGNEAVPGEELIDLETYILGVVYQENGNGPYEALKAQAVAARSFALTRPKSMGGAYGLSLEQEDGQWILSLRSCTNDQVFCNPDKGCWSNVAGGQTGYTDDSECTIFSGYDNTKNWTRGPLSEDSDIRRAVEETKGQVLVDSNGNIINTGYVASVQEKWNTLANNGSDYFEILVASYGTGVSLKTPDYVGGSDKNSEVKIGDYWHPCPTMSMVTDEFGPRWGTYHYGIDIGGTTGFDEIYAFADGTVVEAWGGCVEGDFYCNGQGGNYVSIDHGNGMVTRYLHLTSFVVQAGQKINGGQLIGKMGNTGGSYGNHLHFETKINGTAVNPRTYMVGML